MRPAGRLRVPLLMTACFALAGAAYAGSVPVGVQGSAEDPELAADFELDFVHEITRWVEKTMGDYGWPDSPDEDPFLDFLRDHKRRGYTVAVSYTNVHMDQKHLPPYLKGRAFDDAFLLDRWEKHLEAFLHRYGDFIDFLNLGNEVNLYFRAHRDEWKGFLAFLHRGAAVVKKRRPRIRVGLVLVENGREDDWRDVARWCDHLAITYYAPCSAFGPSPTAQALDPRHPDYFARTLDEALAVAGEKPLLITEIGCPTSTEIDASPALQARLIRAFFAWLAGKEDRVLGASWLGARDWPWEGTKIALQGELDDDLLKQEPFLRFLTSLGLKDEKGRKKPGYAAFREALEAYRARGLPLLPPGNHPGIIRGFNADNPPALTKILDDKWTEALRRGLRVARIPLNWPALEPGPDRVREEELLEALLACQSEGLAPLVEITAIDSESYELPPDLMEAPGTYRLRGGMRLDDPAILARYAKLMDRTVPMMRDHGAWGLVVANEPGNRLDDVPAEKEAMVNFITAARKRVRALAPRLAVLVAMRAAEVDASKPYLRDFLALGDAACFNYYAKPQKRAGMMPALESARLAAVLAAAGDKPVVFHELGCPSGRDEGKRVTEYTPALQEAFFRFFFERMRKVKRIRAAFVFQMVDWSPKTAALFEKALEKEKVPRAFIDAFMESLLTMGLLRFPGGEEKPAWKAFLEALEKAYPRNKR